MPYADMAVYRAAVMMPWDLNLVWPADGKKAALQKKPPWAQCAKWRLAVT